MRLRELRKLVEEVVASGSGGSGSDGLSLEEVQAAIDDGLITTEPQGWRAFAQAGPTAQSYWNSWLPVPDHPLLFRRIGNTVQVTGQATGGVAAPGNALVQMPDDIVAAAPSQTFSGDRSVLVYSGKTYLCMTTGSLSTYDFTGVTFDVV